MKNLICLLTLLMASFAAFGNNNALIAKADSAYNADDFGTAAKLYQKAIKQYGTSATLWYNLGNCHYRLGQMGQAILSYERALRLNPGYDDARANLELTNTKITDRPGERGTFVSNLLDSAACAARSNLWAWIALGCFVLALGGCALYFFTYSVMLRKLGFFGAIVLVIVSGCFVFFSFRSASISMSDKFAVIVKPSTILSTVPRIPKDRTQEAMLLHEGTRVELLDSVKSTSIDSVTTLWYDARIDNEHRAWINAQDIEKI